MAASSLNPVAEAVLAGRMILRRCGAYATHFSGIRLRHLCLHLLTKATMVHPYPYFPA